MVKKDVIGNEAAAALVGVAAKTWSGYVARREQTHAPAPYRREVRGSQALPVWRRAEIERWIAARPGPGAPGKPRKRAA